MLESALLLEFYHQFALVLRGLSRDHVVIIASRLILVLDFFLPGAIFVSIVEFGHVFAEDFLALFACKDDLCVLDNIVIL